ncbi:hypothetical protein K7432_002415 [Basidiobolus ranarum]|uniref:F-box domain-containing protein n=1 Tax=Basidiobolus ranarum TaxID=34480 RepID=A0ABR2X1K5_9FUNG
MTVFPRILLERIFAYVEQGQLLTCSLVCKEWEEIVLPLLWKKPRFGGRFFTRIQSFQKFLQCLVTCRPEVADYVRIIDLDRLEESMYDDIPEDWLNTITTKCSKMEELHVADSNILTFTSLKRVKFQCISIRYIDLTNSKNIGANGFMLLGRIFPNLRQISVSGSAGLNEGTLSQMVYLCDDLQKLEIAHCPSLTDNCIHAVAKFGKGNIFELDLTGNCNLSDKAVQSISMYCCRLKSLTIRECNLITPNGLGYITQGLNRDLERLDVAFCRACPLNDDILNLLSSKLLKLHTFTCSFPQINLNKREIGSIVKTFQQFTKLTHLTIHAIPENVSIEFIKGLVKNCEQLKVLTLYRQTYTSDYIFGFYSKFEKSELIHEENIRKILQDNPKIKIRLECEQMY